MSTSTQPHLAREAAERYQQILVPVILGPAARALVDEAALQAGAIVLDVGCGTGATARAAAEQVGPSGRVLAIDTNPGMLDVARSLSPVPGAVIEWREGRACELPLADASVDVVLCAQTLQFLNDPRRALSDMHRVLKPGGRLAVSLWCDLGENPYFEALVGIVAHRIGRDTAAGLDAAFRLSNADQIRDLLATTGWTQIDLTRKQLDLDLPPLRSFVPRHISATPMAAGFSAAPEAAQQAVIEDMADRLAPYEMGTDVRIPFQTHLATGAK